MKKFAIAIVILVGLSALAFQQANFPGGSGAASLPTGLGFVSPELDVSAAAGGNGILGLAGNTSGIATLTAPAVAGTRTNPISVSNALQLPIGSAANPSLNFAGGGGYGLSFGNVGATLNASVNTSITTAWTANAPIGFYAGSGRGIGFTAGADPSGSSPDTSISRNAANVVQVGQTGTALDSSGTLKFKAQQSDTNCSSAGGTCGSAMAGAVTIAAAATTVTVATTAVTANSDIALTWNSALGTRLSVTCNTTPTVLAVTTITAATSFVITTTAPVTNPACITYQIIN